MHEPGIALGLIVVMLVAAVGAALLLGRVRPLAGWLMVPYLLWLCFATALNWQILELNPGV
jgi:translocator protein